MSEFSFPVCLDWGGGGVSLVLFSFVLFWVVFLFALASVFFLFFFSE